LLRDVAVQTGATFIDDKKDLDLNSDWFHNQFFGGAK